MLYSPRIRSPSFSEPVPLGCDLHKCFSVLFTPLGGTGRLEWAELGISLPPGPSDSDNTPAGQALVKQFP